MMESTPDDLVGPALANQIGWFWSGKRLIKDKPIIREGYLSFLKLFYGDDLIERIVKNFYVFFKYSDLDVLFWKWEVLYFFWKFPFILLLSGVLGVGFIIALQHVLFCFPVFWKDHMLMTAWKFSCKPFPLAHMGPIFTWTNLFKSQAFP